MINKEHLDNIKNLALDYSKAAPFKHVVFNKFLIDKIYDDVSKEFNLSEKVIQWLINTLAKISMLSQISKKWEHKLKN